MGSGPLYIQDGFISGSFADYICRDSVSKLGHVQRHQGLGTEYIFRGGTVQLTILATEGNLSWKQFDISLLL